MQFDRETIIDAIYYLLWKKLALPSLSDLTFDEAMSLRCYIGRKVDAFKASGAKSKEQIVSFLSDLALKIDETDEWLYEYAG